MPMKLIYFDGRGVMEVGRYMLAMSGTEYEDFRYPVESASKSSFRCPAVLFPRSPCLASCLWARSIAVCPTC